MPVGLELLLLKLCRVYFCIPDNVLSSLLRARNTNEEREWGLLG